MTSNSRRVLCSIATLYPATVDVAHLFLAYPVPCWKKSAVSIWRADPKVHEHLTLESNIIVFIRTKNLLQSLYFILQTHKIMEIFVN